MKKLIITAGLVAGGLFAAAGVASADEGQTVIINQSGSSTSGSVSCVSPEVAAQLPSWLQVPVCP